ncbi:hypothetical protein CBOM_01751 [Ceraceosorus bombacis]|uniref:Uncharacterized protein n=1 Tax=Ceraceosorus bombacis TaxID=401625 RepID=A0A0P1BCW3_9BASI|nr:hypothetical protein CBOM_01751 [Ceraceosorus bombacis]
MSPRPATFDTTLSGMEEDTSWATLDKLLLDRTLHLHSHSSLHLPTISSTSGGNSASTGPTARRSVDVAPTRDQFGLMRTACLEYLSPRLASLSASMPGPIISPPRVRVATLPSLGTTAWVLEVSVRAQALPLPGAPVEAARSAVKTTLNACVVFLPHVLIARGVKGGTTGVAAALLPLLLSFSQEYLDTHLSSAMASRALRGVALEEILEVLWNSNNSARARGSQAEANIEVTWNIGALVDEVEDEKLAENLTLAVPWSIVSQACGGAGNAPLHPWLGLYLSSHTSLLPPSRILTRVGLAGVHVGVSSTGVRIKMGSGKGEDTSKAKKVLSWCDRRIAEMQR